MATAWADQVVKARVLSVDGGPQRLQLSLRRGSGAGGTGNVLHAAASDELGSLQPGDIVTGRVHSLVVRKVPVRATIV